MPPYLKLGTVPKKRHIEHRHEPGFRNEGIYYEEVVTLTGFGRAYSVVYHLRPPTRVRKGQLRLGAPYYERDFHGPREVNVIDREQDVTVVVKHGERLTRYSLANHPFDVAGWDGLVYPYTFNADDFEPITGTIHQPPPVQ